MVVHKTNIVIDMFVTVTCKLMLYADDCALQVSGKDMAKMETALSDELELV